MLKTLRKKGIAAKVSIANAMMRLAHFPKIWKEAEVITIPKPLKDSKLPQNYRPISLLTAISKIVERIILPRLQEETENLELLPFGFNGRHRAEQQLLTITEMAAEDYSTSTSMPFEPLAGRKREIYI